MFWVNWKEFPKELSTCVCAAKCRMVSISSSCRTYVTMSDEQMFPLTNCKNRGRKQWHSFVRGEGGVLGRRGRERVTFAATC